MSKSKEADDFKFNSELLKLSKDKYIDSGDIDSSLKLITKTVSFAMNVPRASVWFYNEKMSSIVCACLFEKEKELYSSDLELKEKDFPAYFSYLAEERTLPASDAINNPSTSEFADVYLKPLGIVSMLDSPIRVNGKMIGVVCCEHIGNMREWTMSEQNFVGNITDIIARAVQAKERAIALQKVEFMNASLEKLVKERTEELEEQRARSLYASKMALLGEMAGSIAHEINNPLAIIMSTSKNLKKLESKGQLKPELLRELLGDIEVTTFRIEKIIKGLRFFARDGLHDDESETSMGQIVEDTLALCQEKFLMNGCKIETALQAKDIKLRCQPVSLSQALLNLLSNALDAVADSPEKWIRIQCLQIQNNIQFRVSDSGKGIPTELREKIMLPFFTTKPVGKGTGLGLAIVRGIAEKHGGSFFLDSDSPHTCFVLQFPRQNS